MTSLRSRLLAWTIGGMALVLAVFGVAVYAMARHFASEAFDDSLQDTARALSALVRVENGRAEIEMEDRDMPEFSRARRPAYFELWDGQTVVRRSASLGPQDIDATPVPGKTRWFRPARLPDGRPGRVAVLVFTPKAEREDVGPTAENPNAEGTGDGRGSLDRPAGDKTPTIAHPLMIAVVRETREMDDALASLAWTMAGVGAVSVLIMLVSAAVAVRRGLAPLAALAGRIADIGPENMAARVPTDELPAEIAPVVARLNELLGRLEAAILRERAMTADVAHELRTPIGGLQSTIEVALTRPRDADEYRQTLRDCLEIVRQTGGMTANLLALARLEGGQVPMRPEQIGLAEMVDAGWRPHEAAASGRGVSFQNRVPADLECAADREILAILMANLLANAAEYTDAGGRIEVSGGRADAPDVPGASGQSVASGGARGDAVELTFANTGCTLSAAQAAHVFDRFWRGDSARAATGVHCGLGLSLADRAARVLGGKVAAQVADGRFAVTVVLPAG